MSQVKISDIHGGKPDAKEDINRNRQEFMNTYFIPPNMNVDSLKTGDVCYIVGNKGLGKTASLRYLNQCFLEKNPATISTFLLFERDYTHQVRSGMVSAATQSFVTYGFEEEEEEEEDEDEIDKLDFSLIWRWHLYLTIVRDNKNGKIFFRDDNWKRFERYVTGIFKKEMQVKIAGGVDLQLPENIPSILRFIQPHISIELPEFNIGRKEYTFPEAMKKAEEWFWKLKDSRGVTPYYIFVDELDIHYGDEKGYLRDLRLVHDLAIEVKEINDIILKQGWGQNTKVFCTLRPEILQAIEEKLSARSLKRTMEGYRFDLSWVSDSSETYTLPIMKLFLKRIEEAEHEKGCATGSDMERYERWFPDRIEGLEAARYICQITWSRPRDIVRLLNAAKKLRPNDTSFNLHVFEDLMREYSKGSKEELRGELEASYPPSEIEDIFKCFIMLPERFTLEEFQKRLHRFGWKEEPGHDAESVLSDLYRVGAIGQAFGDEETWQYQDEPYRSVLENIVHRGLIRALGVKTKRRDIGIDTSEMERDQKEARKKQEKEEEQRQEEARKKQKEEEQRQEEERLREEILQKENKPRITFYEGQLGKVTGLLEKAKKHPWAGNPEKVGEIVTFGRYPQEGENATSTGIEWKVLDVRDGKSLLITEYALDAKAYNEEYVDVTWETCTLRRWLNQEFLQKAFTQEEQGGILTSIVQNPDNENYHTTGWNDTKDKVFLLGIGEAKQLFPSDKERLCIPTKYALARNGDIVDKEYRVGCFWWLRSPGYYGSQAARVWPDGSVSEYGRFVVDTGVAVRPALWLDLSS